MVISDLVYLTSGELWLIMVLSYAGLSRCKNAETRKPGFGNDERCYFYQYDSEQQIK